MPTSIVLVTSDGRRRCDVPRRLPRHRRAPEGGASQRERSGLVRARSIPDAIALSVLTVGEIRRGIENLRRRDQVTARALERWLHRLVADYRERIVPVSEAVAEQWGRLNAPDPIPVVDGLLAATALVHGFTLRDSQRA